MSNQIRIIGGRWRGRKITFPDLPGLRPTQDRIRETLFNWLSNTIIDSVCLDCFAGSGALGLEALSRGAAHVVFVDHNRVVIEAINSNIAKLKVEKERFSACYAEIPKQFPSLARSSFTIVFIDPPFYLGLVEKTMRWLDKNNLLAAGALIYAEFEKEIVSLDFPKQWQLIKNKQTASLRYQLYQNNNE